MGWEYSTRAGQWARGTSPLRLTDTSRTNVNTPLVNHTVTRMGALSPQPRTDVLLLQSPQFLVLGLWTGMWLST